MEKESKVVQSHQGRHLGSPLCLCYQDGNSATALSMVFGCSRDGGYCRKVSLLSRPFPFFSLVWENRLCFSRSVQLLSGVGLFMAPGTAARQASLSITDSWNLLKLTSTESVMPSNHLILCCSHLLLPLISPSIRAFSCESLLHIRWPEYWSFGFSISPSDEYSVLISLRMDWLNFLVVQRTLRSLLQHHSSKALILWCSAFFIVLWGCRIVWCTLTSWYLVSLLPVSIIHVSVILLVGFWSWEISFIMWGCRSWGWQAAGTWVSVSREMVGFPAPIGWPGASQSICTQ